ncbi:MAG TPA: gamma-glutamyltransferase [Baekduia sp.]|uniref:gamma-glutamyltransferase n=1 Tax=Baekduia sp. TaxID=2600305 RepID=UPI002CC7A2B4|nr:gamma-glutamyltransferase [Baekduia sp.]HMJ36261.1 gamma-glutamyltransferase [Baekduia sp.]
MTIPEELRPDPDLLARPVPEHAIATPHREATAAGERAFAAGGNALDAALAAAAALTVVYPHNCALGGDLFALVRDEHGKTVSVNASGPAGEATDAGELRRRAPAMPITGPDTITVPGLVAGWGSLHAAGAALPWADALAAAQALAADGVAVAPSLGAAIAAADLSDPGMAAVFAPAGAPLRTGDLLRQQALAATLAALAADGPRTFYDGDVAGRLLEGLAARGSRLTEADLRGFAPEVGAPLRGRFGDLDVLTSPPNSSGVLLLQALAALDATGVADPLGDDAGAFAEILRISSQDRDRWLGDPRSIDVDLDAFLGDARIAELARRAVAGAGGERPPVPVQHRERPRGDTVAVVAVDGSGRAVSLIQSLFHSFGSGILDPGTGVLLHNRGAFFNLREGHPNELAPGRRPAHTLMPVMVDRQGRLRGVLGTMGGRVHAQILAQVLLRLRAGASPQQAVDASRWIVGAMERAERDDVVRVEDGVAPAARAALQRARLRLVDEPRDSESFGHAQAIWLEPVLRAGSDRRADGGAIVG